MPDDTDDYDGRESDPPPSPTGDDPLRSPTGDDPLRSPTDDDVDASLDDHIGVGEGREERFGADASDDASDDGVGTAVEGDAAASNPEKSLQRLGETTAGFESISRSDLREHYGPLRTFFKRRASSYQGFQRRLTQAWLRDTYDVYLATLAHRMLGIVAGALAVAVVAAVGILAIPGPLSGVLAATGLSTRALAGLVAAAVVFVGVAAASAYWFWRRVYRIRVRIGQRRREIDYNLPYAVTFMYALSRAGVSFDRILMRLADAEETYGAVSQEFDRVVRDVEMFGNNLYTGLENLQTVTPSDQLRRFTDDVTTVIESGGDVSTFLRDELDEQFDAAIEEQEAFVERLELLSEVFVVGFVAAPLFVLVVLIVVSFLGAEMVGTIGLLVYVVFPLALVGFVLLVDHVSRPFRSTSASFTPGRERPSPPPERADDPDWRGDYERTKRLRGVRKRLRAELVAVRDDPRRAFLFSVPVAVVLPVVGVALGAVSPSQAALVADPVGVTTQLVVAPLVVATAPVAALYEYRSRQDAAFRRRFPDVLDLLAVSNRRGLSLTAALAIAADSTGDRIDTELKQLRNDIRWNADVAEAFEAFGDRLSSPVLTRTVKLVAEGSRATSDLHAVLSVAATDTAERARLERKRRQALQSYVAIVVIGFLVYLLVVSMLSTSFLEPIETYSAEVSPAVDSGPVSLGAIPVDRLRTLLFHSALIQGFGSGLLAGKLAEDSLYAGLKYAVGLVVLAVVVFALV